LPFKCPTRVEVGACEAEFAVKESVRGQDMCLATATKENGACLTQVRQAARVVNRRFCAKSGLSRRKKNPAEVGFSNFHLLNLTPLLPTNIGVQTPVKRQLVQMLNIFERIERQLARADSGLCQIFDSL
jgi:hypothetical protein